MITLSRKRCRSATCRGRTQSDPLPSIYASGRTSCWKYEKPAPGQWKQPVHNHISETGPGLRRTTAASENSISGLPSDRQLPRTGTPASAPGRRGGVAMPVAGAPSSAARLRDRRTRGVSEGAPRQKDYPSCQQKCHFAQHQSRAALGDGAESRQTRQHLNEPKANLQHCAAIAVSASGFVGGYAAHVATEKRTASSRRRLGLSAIAGSTSATAVPCSCLCAKAVDAGHRPDIS